MIAWALEALIATTLLMLLVLTIRTPVRRAFGPDMAYALWALPALRLFLPPMPESWRQSAAAPIAQASDVVITYIYEPLTGAPTEVARAVAAGAPAQTPIDLWPYLLAAWAIGAIGFVGYHLVSHSRFCARIRRMAGAARMVTANNVAVIETSAATGPLAFGIWRKYVAFPRDFAERYDPVERDLALAHELGHHARGDLLANWAALIMLGAHWFNPVAWRAFRAFRADQEMACDALVLAGRAAEMRHAYGRAIVKSAHGGAVSAACHLHTINELKGRLRMLTRHERLSRKQRFFGVGAIAALTLGGLAVTASGTQAAERVRSGIEKTTGVDIAALELPIAQGVQALTAPVAPVAPDAPVAPTAPEPPVAPEPGDKRVKRVIVVRDKDGNVTRQTLEGDDVADLEDIGGEGGVQVHSRSFVMNDKDGSWKTNGTPMPPMPPMPPEALAQLKNMPQVSSRNCKPGEGGNVNENVIRTDDGKIRRVIICTNRIEARAKLASDQARQAQLSMVNVRLITRDANRAALNGLRTARESVRSAEGMTAEQRSEALKGIDEAIREMESQKDD